MEKFQIFQNGFILTYYFIIMSVEKVLLKFTCYYHHPRSSTSHGDTKIELTKELGYNHMSSILIENISMKFK